MKRNEKTIFHMDGDSFFVGVEVARDQTLKGLPVVTGADRGIVTAASYEAKALGVTRGMPIFQLKKKFPNVIIKHGDYKAYVEYSGMMCDIVRRYIDDVEEYSIDECFGDLTGLDRTLKMPYGQIAQQIKTEVNDELKLSVSVGVGPTKVLAKVASKWVKPNGFTVIERAKIFDFLTKTPISKIWGIGWRTAIMLEKLGIKTASDFALKDGGWVEENLSKPFKIIWQELNGISILDVDAQPKATYSSIQKTRSFSPPTSDESLLFSRFSKNIEEACDKARYFKLIPRRVSYFLKTRDFKYMNSLSELLLPTNSPEIIMSDLIKNFHKMYIRGVKYRTTGVVLSELVPENSLGCDLFGNMDKARKFEMIHKKIDALEDKMGKKLVYLASTHEAIQNSGEGIDADSRDKSLLFL